MFNFMKKTSERDEKEKRKRDKKERKDVKKRDRGSMSADELLRLDEVRRSLKIRGRRKEKEKLPSGITADYSASFFAQLDRDLVENTSCKSGPSTSWNRTPDGLTQSDSSEASLTSLTNVSGRSLPPLPPKPPKRGILKGSRINISNIATVAECTGSDVVQNGNEVEPNHCEASNLLVRNTLQNEVIAYQNMQNPNNQERKDDICSEEESLFQSHHYAADSLTDTTNSSFATPPFSLSPIGESQGFSRWRSSSSFEEQGVNLSLPEIIPLVLPEPRELTIQRQPPPRNDFGFSLRRGTIIDRCINGSTPSMKAVIFAEPGAMIQNNNDTGLLPGDRLIGVNGLNVEDMSREEIIDLIKKCPDYVSVKVQPVAELSELSRRGGSDGRQVELAPANIRSGTLRRSGSLRFHQNTARSEEHVAQEHSWLAMENVWLLHRGGFTAATRCDVADPDTGKLRVRLVPSGEELLVDEEDVEKANPTQFDMAEELSQLRFLNESSVLHTLRQRYANNLIHTYVGDSMIVINPIAPLAIYSEKVVRMFKGCKSEDMPPHIYAIAQSAYRGMLATRRDHSIVFLGRSGAGKTINFKHVLHYLVLAAGTVNKILTIEKLNALFTILEAFGNCRTHMNFNATRFTQLFSLDFDQSGQIASASVQALLLEKSRIGRRTNGDLTFHILYRLLAGAEGSLRKDLNLTNLVAENNPFITPLQKHEDKQRAMIEFNRIVASFKILGVSESDEKAIWITLAGIYHLSCAGAIKTGSTSTQTRWQFARVDCAEKAANLLGTTVEELSTIVFRMNSSGGIATHQNSHVKTTIRTPSPTETPIKDGSGLDCLEGLIIGLYSEVFHCIVSLINKSISSSSHTVSSILLCDAPGFQNPASCGRQTGANFEDLCHNYLQERLQLLFHYTALVAPKNRYAQEAIDVDYNEEYDGDCIGSPQALISLLDRGQQSATLLRSSQNDLNGRLQADKKGLLWLLDEEAVCASSSDETFLDRLFTHYGDRDCQVLLRKAPGNNQFVLQHLQGTNPVLYTATGWLKATRENPVTKNAITILQESTRENLSRLFVQVRGAGATGGINGPISGMEGTQSLRRASSIRRTFTTAQRKNACVQVKLNIDGLIETLRRTRVKFVHCLLPQHNASSTDNKSFLTVKSNQNENSLINVPLLRSQIRGGQIVDSVRLHKVGFPRHMPLSEFRRRFGLLSSDTSARPGSPVADERRAVEDMLLSIDVNSTSYRVGQSQIFFRIGALEQLESQRDDKLTGRIILLQARCRGYLARKKLNTLKLQDIAVRCIQRNVRKLMSVREWPWWRLYVKVAPLLNVQRTEDQLKARTEELELLRAKVEKLELERSHLKHDNDKLEAKLSVMTADFAEEHSTSTLAAERIDAETSERLRLERELHDINATNKNLQQTAERLEMELLYARAADFNSGASDGEECDDGGVYKQRYEHAIRELEFIKRKMAQQHEDDLEQLVGLKKQLEKKLADAYEEVEEQRQVVAQWKRRVQKLNGEMHDLRLLLEEQTARNNLLEKKQRKFDSETQNLMDDLRQEKTQKERIMREKELAIAEKFTMEQNLSDARLEIELQEERLHNLNQELEEMTFGGKTEEEVAQLKKAKHELDKKCKDQEEELDDLAGQIQILEQAKLRLEMSIEQQRKEMRKEIQQRDDELEDIRGNTHKKIKMMETQLENEHEERTILLREKHELERRLVAYEDQDRTDRAADADTVQRLKRDLKRTRALLKDAQTMLERSKGDSTGKAAIRQLRNQLEDAECAQAVAVKAKQALEQELNETQAALEEVTRCKSEAEDRANIANRERTELISHLEENEEELAEVLKKYRATVQQISVEQAQLQEAHVQIASLEAEKSSLKDQLMDLSQRLESVEQLGDPTANSLATRRLEFRAKELESKLELEQTTRARLETQIARLKETVDKLQTETALLRTKEQTAQDTARRLQRSLRDVREEVNSTTAREQEATRARRDLEKALEISEAETKVVRDDLRLALQRIDDLQSAIQGELDLDCSEEGTSENSDDSD